MATTFPTTLQDLDATRGTANQPLNNPSHVTHHTLEDDTMEAIQTKLGIDSSAVTTSHDYKLQNVTGSDKAASVAGTETLTNKTLTSPKIGTSILDTNGNELFKLTATASAINELTLANGAAGGNPIVSATGDDTDIGISFTPKGAGKIRITANDLFIPTAGNIQPNGSDPVRGMYIPASGLTAATTNGAATGTIETGTNKVIASVKDFDQTTQEFVGLAIQSPTWWNASTVTVQFIWTAASGTGAVVWAAQGIAFSDDDAMDTAYGTEQTATDTLITAVDDHHSPVTSAITIAGTPAAGDLVCLRFKRNPADAGDTLNADARLIAVRVRWTMGQYDDV